MVFNRHSVGLLAGRNSSVFANETRVANLPVGRDVKEKNRA
jgi:hypothetical protein